MVVIGIDVGTQSLKAIVFDDDLRVIGENSIAYQPSFPRPGWAEQDPQLWLDALRPTIAGAIFRAQVKATDIFSVGVTGQLDGCVPVDGDGKALASAIIWMDRRATAEVVGIDPDWILERTGNVLDSTHMAAKISWSQRHLSFDKSWATWHQPVSFIVAALCGRNVLDHSLASTTMLYDAVQRGWSDDLLSAFDVDSRQLPEIADAIGIAGTITAAGAELTGLLRGTKVVVGTGDDFAGAIGAGVIEPGTVSCTLGTAEVVGAVSNDFRIDRGGLVETHGFLNDQYFLENPGWLSGGAVTWFLSAFGIDSPTEMSALAESARPGSDGLLFLPALSGSMAPRWNSHARGAFYGLTAAHGRAEMARSVLEGCAFAMRDVVDRLEQLNGTLSSIRLSGGGARSDVWTQMRADISGLPVEVVANVDSAPLGAALLATQSIEISSIAIDRTVLPDPQRREVYQRSYQRYRKLFESLSPMFEE